MPNNNRFISPYNTFPPQAHPQVVGYARDPKEFKLNEYVQYCEAPAPVGFFPSLQPDQAVRMVNEAEWSWEDGSPRPKGNYNLSMFTNIEYACYRRAIPYTLGLQAVQNARKLGSFDPEVWEAKSCASQMKTMQTQRVITLLQTASGWSGQTADANSLNGARGKWDTASEDENSGTHLAIKRSLMAAVRAITLSTNAKVRTKDLVLIVSPDDAIKMAATSEVHNYVKYMASTKVLQEGGLANVNEQWGLPDTLYGIKVVVEDSPQVTVYQNADGTVASVTLNERTFVKANGSAILVARPGGIDAPFGAHNFSTAQIFWYGGTEMETESRQDSWNKIVEGSVASQFKELLAAPGSGFLITNIT